MPKIACLNPTIASAGFMDKHTHHRVYISRLYSAVRAVARKEVPIDLARFDEASTDEAVQMLIDAYGPIVVYEASKQMHGEEPGPVRADPSVTERKENREPDTEGRESTFRHQPEHRPAWSASSDRDE